MAAVDGGGFHVLWSFMVNQYLHRPLLGRGGEAAEATQGAAGGEVGRLRHGGEVAGVLDAHAGDGERGEPADRSAITPLGKAGKEGREGREGAEGGAGDWIGCQFGRSGGKVARSAGGGFHFEGRTVFMACYPFAAIPAIA